MGVISTLTAGFETVNRRLWLLLFPIGLDLLLWCGPRVSIAPLVRRAAAWWLTSDLANAYSPQQIIALRQELETWARSFNLLTLLTLAAPSPDALFQLFAYVFTNILGLPVLARVQSSAVAAPPIPAPTLELNDPGPLLVVTALTLAAGAFLSALFLGLIAQIVREGEVEISVLARRMSLHALYLGAYLVLGSALIVIGSLPLLILAMPWVLTQPVVGALLAMTPWLGLGFYLFFAPGAIVMNDVHPIRAVWYSLHVVRLDVWQALAFVMTVSVIQAGLAVLWRPIMAWPWGLGLGIVGNAYVGAGLTTATLIFYRERYREWREIVMAAGPR